MTNTIQNTIQTVELTTTPEATYAFLQQVAQMVYEDNPEVHASCVINEEGIRLGVTCWKKKDAALVTKVKNVKSAQELPSKFLSYLYGNQPITETLQIDPQYPYSKEQVLILVPQGCDITNPPDASLEINEGTLV